MKEKKKFGLESQSYAAPRAESVEVSNEGMLCSSPSDLEGSIIETFVIDDSLGLWENP